MKKFRIYTALSLALLLLIPTISLSACKKTKPTGEDGTDTTDTLTTPIADDTTQKTEQTTNEPDDTTPPEVEKTSFELFSEATEQMRESSYLNADFSLKYVYSLSGVAQETKLSGNTKSSMIEQKPVSLMSLNVNTNGAKSTATIYSDEGFIYTNEGGKKTKAANQSGSLSPIPFFEEDSVFDLRHSNDSDTITFTGKSIAVVFAPITELYIEKAAATGVKTTEISDVAFTAITDKNGVISKLEYSFDAVLTFPGAVNINVEHTGNITFNSFSNVTVTPPTDLSSYTPDA